MVLTVADVASFFSGLGPSIALVGSVEVCATASRFCPNQRWWRLVVCSFSDGGALLITGISITSGQENAAKGYYYLHLLQSPVIVYALPALNKCH